MDAASLIWGIVVSLLAFVGIGVTSDGWGGDRWRRANRLSWFLLGVGYVLVCRGVIA